MKTIYIKTQRELDNLIKKGVQKDEEVYIEVDNLTVTASFDVWGFLEITGKLVWGSSSAVLRGSSSAVLWGSSSAELLGSSRAELWESSVSWVYSDNVIVNLFGFAVACAMGIEAKIIRKHKTATIINIPKFEGSWEEYEGRYPVKVTKSKAILYKMVHKNKDGVYFSDYNKDYLYKIGETYKEKNAPKEKGSCASGIHVAHKLWALSFGSGWSDGALLECSVDTKNIVVAQDCDGKVRASEVLVVREVPKDEWYTLDFTD